MYEGEGRVMYAEAAEKRPGALDDLDRELVELDEVTARLAQMLAPITNQYMGSEKVLSEPRPEPATPLRGRVERVRAARERLVRLMADIDL